MTRLLIATTNPAKLAEYRLLLGEYRLEPISLRDAGIAEQPEETGASFAENALIKARFYFSRAAMATLADDGGLEIDALGGEPGVRSHRWLGAGRDNPDDALVAEVFRRMDGVARRSARIRAALALVWRDRAGRVNERVAEGAIEGVVAARPYPHIRAGFPYRAVLWLPERGCYLGELGEAEEARISQRRVALGKLADALARVAAGG
jgi:XTP/dITP diphosphohydrolase